MLVPPLHTGQELLHGYLHTFIPQAPGGSWQRLTPGSVPADDSDTSGALPPARLPIRVTAREVDCCLLPPVHLPIRLSPGLFYRSPGRGVGQPTVSLHEVSTVQVWCVLPVFPSVSHRAAGSAAHSVTGLGVNCEGVLPPARLPFYRSPGRWVGPPTHRDKSYDCWCPASGLFLPGLPSGPAGVDVTPTRIMIPTSRADGQ